MQIRVLGSAGSETPGHNPPAFLVDDCLLLDAGTITLSLDREAQCKITHIFLTHAHLDHIKGIPFLVDNIVSSNQVCQLTILSGWDVIADLKRNIFNNRIWPDFTTIPSPDLPVMRYEQISSRDRIEVADYRIYATRVNHGVPAYGYMIEGLDGNAFVYTGDTGPTERIWKRTKEHRVKALVIEASFPNAMEELALASGHLTPALMKKEIEKMPILPERIYVTHIKPFYRETIEEQLAEIEGMNIQPLHTDMIIRV